MNQLQRVKLALALEDVESLFPYRLLKRRLRGLKGTYVDEYSTIYRPSYVQACAKLEKLIS